MPCLGKTLDKISQSPWLLLLSHCHVQLFCDPMDRCPPSSSVHGISQAKILQWVAIFFSRGSSRPVFLGFSGGSAGKETACSVGDLDLIPRLGRSPGEGNGSPLQYSGLENSMDCIVHGVAKSRTHLSDFHFTSLTRVDQGLNPCPQQ